MDKNVTIRQLERDELSAIEGGLGRGYGSLFTLWRDIRNNGGYVDPTPPPATQGIRLLDASILLTSAYPQ
jgi:hypothetical protein